MILAWDSTARKFDSILLTFDATQAGMGIEDPPPPSTPLESGCTPLTWDTALYSFDTILLTFDATEFCAETPETPAAYFNPGATPNVEARRRKRKSLSRILLLLA